jgi:hypothetical protein
MQIALYDRDDAPFAPALVAGLQDRNDLLFRVPLALHRPVLSQGQNPFTLDQFNGATSAGE